MTRNATAGPWRQPRATAPANGRIGRATAIILETPPTAAHQGDRRPSDVLRRPGERLYRPGIDGLRALAVMGVLLYHAGVRWTPGGLLGVDLFFVISGFLITSLLIGELQRSGRIALAGFYGRRARRLFPALAAVLALAVGAMALFRPGDLVRFRE